MKTKVYLEISVKPVASPGTIFFFAGPVSEEMAKGLLQQTGEIIAMHNSPRATPANVPSDASRERSNTSMTSHPATPPASDLRPAQEGKK